MVQSHLAAGEDPHGHHRPDAREVHHREKAEDGAPARKPRPVERSAGRRHPVVLATGDALRVRLGARGPADREDVVGVHRMELELGPEGAGVLRLEEQGIERRDPVRSVALGGNDG
jgi:hypothetical protein